MHSIIERWSHSVYSVTSIHMYIDPFNSGRYREVVSVYSVTSIHMYIDHPMGDSIVVVIER